MGSVRQRPPSPATRATATPSPTANGNGAHAQYRKTNGTNGKHKPGNGAAHAPSSLSRDPSPNNSMHSQSSQDSKEHKHHIEAGLQPASVYASMLGPWRDGARRWCVAGLPAESEWIAGLQQRYRSPQLDKFFFWTAIFGTHTFFTAFLPLPYLLGYPEMGLILNHVVGLGIFTSCVAKDLVCTPRPLAPPVTRLSVSTHHREYGFPSSHSTNAIGIAIQAGQWLLNWRGTIGSTGVALGWILFFVYYASVAGGRLYTGMHTRVDVIGGSLLGFLCWGFWQLVGDAMVAWVNTGTLWVPGVLVPLTLAVIHYHPETPDDCPCFEDSIAMVSVLLGITLGKLHGVRAHIVPDPPVWDNGLARGLFLSILRVSIGICIIFMWRLIVKNTLLRVLPPIFRLASKVTHLPLPTRRFYKAATSYKGQADAPIRPIPSLVELRRSDTSDSLTPPSGRWRGNSPSPNYSPSITDEPIQMKFGHHNHAHYDVSPGGTPCPCPPRRQRRPHYDAEVLTKVVVYMGIGLLASTFLPHFVFPAVEDMLGMSVRG